MVIKSFVEEERTNKLSQDRHREVVLILETLAKLDVAENSSLKRKGPKALLLELFSVLCECITTNDKTVKENLQKLFKIAVKELQLDDV